MAWIKSKIYARPIWFDLLWWWEPRQCVKNRTINWDLDIFHFIYNMGIRPLKDWKFGALLSKAQVQIWYKELNNKDHVSSGDIQFSIVLFLFFNHFILLVTYIIHNLQKNILKQHKSRNRLMGIFNFQYCVNIFLLNLIISNNL